VLQALLLTVLVRHMKVADREQARVCPPEPVSGLNYVKFKVQ